MTDYSSLRRFRNHNIKWGIPYYYFYTSLSQSQIITTRQACNTNLQPNQSELLIIVCTSSGSTGYGAEIDKIDNLIGLIIRIIHDKFW